MAYDKDWRQKELSLDEVISKYPDIPPLVILKTDIHRRGVTYTEAALSKLDPEKHLVNRGIGFYSSTEVIPQSLTLPDGSYINQIFNNDPEAQRDPYVIDLVDDKVVITDNGNVLSEVGFWEKPDFYDKLTSNGRHMYEFVGIRPQRLDIHYSNYCHFWDCPGHGCKYCTFTPNYKKNEGKVDEINDYKYVREVLAEALKQEGRYSYLMFSGGSVLSGKELLDDELNGYIQLLQVAGEFFKTRRFPSTLVATAFSEKQIERLYNETGLMTYTPDLEVLNKKLFEWICPGKAANIGYDEWKRRMYYAVDVFGWGNITTGLVLGVEMARPQGFKTEEESIAAILEEAEDVVSHGVGLAANVWKPSPGSVFHNQNAPSLDYYINLYRQFDILHHKYNVSRFVDDYRRCGTHPGLDLLRI